MFGKTLLKIKNLFASKYIEISRTKASLILAAIIFLFNNSKFFINKFKNLMNQDFTYADFWLFWLEITLHCFLIFILFFILSFNKKLFNIFAIIIFILGAVFAYVYNSFGILIDQTIISNAVDNINDADRIIDYFSVVIYTIIFVAIPSYLVFKIKIIPDNGLKNYYYIIAIFLLFVISLSSFNHTKRKGAILAYAPVNFIDSSLLYYQELRKSAAYKKNLVKISTIVGDAKISSNKIPNLKLVLIIGESARSNNFSINGYTRNTNPRLSKIKNLISYSNVYPCANLTSFAVSCMLSGKSEKEFFSAPDNSETIIKLFENLSFRTSWFSTQKAVGDNNTLLFIGTQAQKYIFKNVIAKNIGGKNIYDEYLLSYLDKEIAVKKDEFIVLHTEGSHFIYDDRYPENFRIFTPTCPYKSPDKCAKESIINSYDNSILYTDYFISKVIEELKDQNAILFYVSDHGQFLGEDGVYYHGNLGNHKDQAHKVPMFLWMSDALLKNPYYKHKFQNALLKKNQKLSHDNLFDSLLDCSGIEAKILDRNLSICM